MLFRSAQGSASSSSSFETLLAGFEQARQARASNASSDTSNTPVNSAQNGQILPQISKNQYQQKNSGSDPMQLLMAQLLAQSTLGQLTSANSGTNSLTNANPSAPDGTTVSGVGSIQDILARLGISSSSLSGQLGGGAQNSLMNLALLKALSASGQTSGSSSG